MQARPEDTRTEISCRDAKGIILYLRRHHGAAALAQVFSQAGLPVEYVNVGSNWLSFDAFNRLLDALVEFTGDEDAPRKVGKLTSEPSIFGPVRVVGKKLFSIHGVYRIMAMHSQYFVKICDWEMLDHAPGYVRLEIRYHEGYRQTRHNCANIRGHLSSIPTWLDCKPAEVRHAACIVDGAESCVYDIHWTEAPADATVLVGALGGVLAGLLGFFVPGWLRVSPWLWAFVTASLGISFAAILSLVRHLRATDRQHQDEWEHLMQSLAENEMLNTGLQRQVEARTKELRKANALLEQALADLRASRDKALQAEREAAIGVLASGMAHDMNSPLNAIRLTLQALMESPPPDAGLRALVAGAERASTRCRRLVSDLLAFSREPRPSPNIDLRGVVEKCLELFVAESSPGVETAFRVADAPPPMLLDEAQMRQAILNLMANACDAMGGKGRIELRLGREGEEVVLEVADNGPGMDDDVKAHAFEPFFTTKRTGQGHGLGLPITQQLVQRNGGRIELDSRPGGGTTFRLSFPLASAVPTMTQGV